MAPSGCVARADGPVRPVWRLVKPVRTGRYRLPMPRQRGNTGLLGHFRSGVARYRAVASLPGAAAFFGTAAVARLGVAMTSLAVLWAVRGATGSFAAAGVTTAVFALAEATAGPQVARLVEDRGQRRILPCSVTVFVIAVSGLIAGARLRLPLMVLAVMAMMAGASIPQVGALSAARWRHTVRTPDQAASHHHGRSARVYPFTRWVRFSITRWNGSRTVGDWRLVRVSQARQDDTDEQTPA